MTAKLEKYFVSGVRLVWYIDPETRSARVYTDAHCETRVPPDGILAGADVLPGFQLPLKSIFDEVDRLGPRHP